MLNITTNIATSRRILTSILPKNSEYSELKSKFKVLTFERVEFSIDTIQDIYSSISEQRLVIVPRMYRHVKNPRLLTISTPMISIGSVIKWYTCEIREQFRAHFV